MERKFNESRIDAALVWDDLRIVTPAEAQRMGEALLDERIGRKPVLKLEDPLDVDLLIEKIKECVTLNGHSLENEWDDETLKKLIDNYGHAISCEWHTQSNS